MEPKAEVSPDFNFPFDPYEIQRDFMRVLYSALEKGQIGIFESPTGTGKSLSLICASLTWLRDSNAKKRQELQNALEDSDGINAAQKSSDDPFDWLNENATIIEKSQKLDETRMELEKLEKVDEKLAKMRQMSKKLIQRPVKRTLNDGKIDDFTDFESIDQETDPDSEIAPVEYLSDEETSTKKFEFFAGNPANSKSEDTLAVRKIFYCSRTHSQLAQFLQEIRKTGFGGSVRAVTLGSRQTFCINDDVRKLNSVSAINERCLEMQKNKSASNKASKVAGSADEKPKRNRQRQPKKSKCQFYKSEAMQDLADDLILEIRDIESSVSLAKKEEACPYYASRYAVPLAEVVLLPYQILFHESTRKSCGVDLTGSVVIVDEAHNLQEALASIYSVSITKEQLNIAQSQLSQYIQRFRERLKAKNLLYVRQLRQSISALIGCVTDSANKDFASQKEPLDKVWRVVDFLFEAKLSDVNFYKLLKYMDKSEIAKKLTGFVAKYAINVDFSSKSVTKNDENLSGVKRFLKQQQDAASKNSIKEPAPEEESGERRAGSSPMFQVRAFLETFTYSAEDGRVLTKGNTQSLRFLLLNPLSHFKSVTSSAHSVILAGGTMQPEGELRNELLDTCQVPIDRMTSFSCGHVIGKNQLLPLAVGVGPAGKIGLNFSFESRKNKPETATEFGRLLSNIVRIVPGGLIIFFTSYDYEAIIVEQLKAEGFWGKLEEKKRIFREPKAAKDVDGVLEDYAKAIKGPKKGAILLAVVGGKMSEGINFSDDLGRCVVMVGLPYPNMNSVELKEKLAYLDLKKKSDRLERNQAPARVVHCESLCWKAINQSVGRAIRHKNDYAAILLVDERFCSEKTRKRLPHWIGEQMEICNKNFGSVICKLKQFFDAKKV